MNHHVRYLDQRLLCSKLVVRTRRHTQWNDRCTGPLKWSVKINDIRLK